MAITTDLHMHSTHSFDGKSSMHHMCVAAIERGITHVCFTEHYDCNPESRAYGHFNLDSYLRDIEECRRKFGDRLEILTGIEFGEPHKYPVEVERVQNMGFDVILGAVHRIHLGPISTLAANGFDAAELFRLYYGEVLTAVGCGGFDVMAHLDFPKRHVGAGPEMTEWVDRIFAEMLRQGIVPEINTSTCEGAANECCPDVPLIKRWAALGGSRLVIGSDAHASTAVARHFDQAERVLGVVGLPHGCFRNRAFHFVG